MDIKKLTNLLKKEERPKLDFKLTIDLWTEGGKKEFAKDVCAIANSKGGRGYIIAGIMDKTKEIVGVNNIDSFFEEKVQQIISSRCEPPIPIALDFIKIDSKDVLVVTIFDGEQKPYQIRETGAFYIRRGSTTDVMRKQEILRLFEANLDLNIETCPVIKSTVDYINYELISKYFSNKGIYINNDNKYFLMETAGIIFKERDEDKYICTLGGLLVFSERNALCISNNIIRIINKINSEIPRVTLIQGSLLTMINKAENIIAQIMPGNYPVTAIYEAIKNAVLYREYAETDRIIEIVISQKSVIIESPGERISKQEFGSNENYVRRNMWIYEKLITLDNNTVFTNDSRGFSRMKNAFKGVCSNRVKFINLPLENTFKVILPGILDIK